MPKGLQIKNKPFADREQETNLPQRLFQITQQAQSQYMETLIEHHQTIENKQRIQISKLNKEMDILSKNLLPTD